MDRITSGELLVALIGSPTIASLFHALLQWRTNRRVKHLDRSFNRGYIVVPRAKWEEIRSEFEKTHNGRSVEIFEGIED